MKQMFGFLLLIAVGLLLLTVITGMGGIFTSIAATWTVAQTAEIATGLTQVLWLGGIVTVMVLGFSLFNSTTKSSRLFGGSRGQSNQQTQQYQVIDGVYQQVQSLPEPRENDFEDWYQFDEKDMELR